MDISNYFKQKNIKIKPLRFLTIIPQKNFLSSVLTHLYGDILNLIRISMNYLCIFLIIIPFMVLKHLLQNLSPNILSREIMIYKRSQNTKRDFTKSNTL